MLPTSCPSPTHRHRTSPDEAATSSGDDEDSDNPSGAGPGAAAVPAHASAPTGATQQARSRLGQGSAVGPGAKAQERIAERDLQGQVRMSGIAYDPRILTSKSRLWSGLHAGKCKVLMRKQSS
jgi:hypothetical protein